MQTCIHCGKEFIPNHRVRNQRYCSDKKCQQARKSQWQRKQMAKDPAYRENQQRCWKDWIKAHPRYWMEYRAKHHEYTARNRNLQIIRNAKRNKDKTGKLIAKMDALARVSYRRRSGLYKLIPQDRRMIAKMDALTVRLVPLSSLKSIREL